MSQDRKKHQKEVKRRRQVEEKRKHQADRQRQLKRLAEYPDIIFTGRADPAFEGLVRNAISELPFDSQVFQDWERQVYRAIKSGGWGAAKRLLDKYQESPVIRGKVKSAEVWFIMNLGHQVFCRIGQPIEQHLLWNDVQFVFQNNSVVGEFRSLESQPSKSGRVYYSPHRPEITFDSEQYICSYSRHAIEAIANRATPRWNRYDAHGDAFYFFHGCKHIVGGTMRHQEGQFGPCFSLFEPIQNGSVRIRHILEGVLGDLVEDDGSGLYARIGYCPVVFDGHFAKATTFVPPGYSKTPEASLYNNYDIPFDVRERMRTIGTANEPGYGVFHADPDLLRVFHQCGYPQVIRGSDPCFAHLNSASPS